MLDLVAVIHRIILNKITRRTFWLSGTLYGSRTSGESTILLGHSPTWSSLNFKSRESPFKHLSPRAKINKILQAQGQDGLVNFGYTCAKEVKKSVARTFITRDESPQFGYIGLDSINVMCSREVIKLRAK